MLDPEQLRMGGAPPDVDNLHKTDFTRYAARHEQNLPVHARNPAPVAGCG